MAVHFKAALWRFFFRHEHGNVAIIFGLSAFVLISATALAVDYHRASALHSRLQAAADTAVLAAINTDSTNGPQIEARARALFEGSLNASDLATIASLTTSYETTPVKTVRLDFNAASPNTISSVANVDAFPVRGNAVAVADVPISKRFHFLLDVSSSMGLAATPVDRNALRNATLLTSPPGTGGCEFACHGINEQATVINLQVARSLGIRLRLDAAREGIANMVALAEAQRRPTVIYEYGLTSFASQLWPVSLPTQNAPLFLSRMNAIELGDGVPVDLTHTLYHVSIPEAIAHFNSLTGPAIEEIVILITDGFQNSGAEDTNDDKFPIPVAHCDAIKASGRKVAVVYLEQFPLPHDDAWNEIVSPYVWQVENNLRACASDNLFVKGLDHIDIVSAFSDLFSMINERRSVRLTD